jgi:hypothetical protein
MAEQTGGTFDPASQSKEAMRATSEWRVSGGRDRKRTALPRMGPVAAAIAIVAAMVYGLHLLFV